MTEPPNPVQPVETPETAAYSLWALVLYALRLGALGFGGPVALVGYMRRDLVEQRQWIAEADYNEGLALATLGILLKTTRVPEPLLVVGAALIGVLVYPLVHH